MSPQGILELAGPAPVYEHDHGSRAARRQGEIHLMICSFTSVLSHRFPGIQSSQNSPGQGALRRQYPDIGKKRNAVMADSVISRRARPVRLLGLLRSLAMERPLPADRAYPEALQDALKAWKPMGQDTGMRQV